MRGAIHKILKHSAVDGPGNRLVVFFQGCNFSCSYCHNPETIKLCTHCGNCIESCPTKALSMENNKVLWQEERCNHCDTCIQLCQEQSSPKVRQMSVSQIMTQIEKVRPFISGVTLSGGECTQQFDFLKELLVACKQQNISTFVDTNAHLEFDKMKELSAYFDKAMPDVKIFDNAQHLQLTGKSSELVFKNIAFLLQENKVHEIRTVIYPQYNYEETVEKVSALIASYNKNISYKLIKFRPHGSKTPSNIASPTSQHMLLLKQLAENKGFTQVELDNKVWT